MFHSVHPLREALRRRVCVSHAPGLALMAAGLGAPVVVMAQDGDPLVPLDPRQAITVTATRTPTPVGEVPATVSVITDRQIADEMVATIKDLIRFEPGVSVHRGPARFGAASGTTGRDGNGSFNIRGLEGNRVLIQVDGVRVPDGFEFGAQSAGRGDYVDLGLVKSVEILRGPASALYGSDGLAGAVSFVTADPEDIVKGGRSIAGRGRVSYDSADRKWNETATLAGRSGDWSAMAAYTRRDGHEFRTMGTNGSANANRTMANPQVTQSNAVLAKLVWAPAGEHRVRLTLDHLDDHVASTVLSGIAATAAPASTSVIGLTSRDTIRRDRVSLDWRWQGVGFIDQAQVTGWYQQAKNRQFSAEDRYTAADRTRLNSFDNRVIGLSAELHSGFATGALRHALVYGGDASWTRQEGVRDGTVPTAPETFPVRAFPPTDFTLAGAYLGDQVAVGPLTLYPVLRFDHYALTPRADSLTSGLTAAAQSGSRVSPKIGATWKLGGPASVFATYAQGFKAPSPTQVNQFFSNLTYGYTSVPNPNLRPETSETVEGGIRVAQGGISAGITGFTGWYRNFISQQVVSGGFTPTNPAIYQFINLARVRISGVEGQMNVRAKSGLSARLAISYAKGNSFDGTGAGTPLDTIDPLKLVAGLGYDAPGGRFGGQLIATHAAEKEISAVSSITLYRPGAFTILDATAYARLGQALTARVGVFNLTNARYAWWSDVRGLAASSTVTDAYTQPGRNVSASLTATF